MKVNKIKVLNLLWVSLYEIIWLNAFDWIRYPDIIPHIAIFIFSIFLAFFGQVIFICILSLITWSIFYICDEDSVKHCRRNATIYDDCIYDILNLVGIWVYSFPSLINRVIKNKK